MPAGTTNLMFLLYGTIPQSFHSHHGPAYLFNHAVNVTLGPPEERDMTTGRHVVRNLFCIGCSTVLGWRYEAAYEDAEKYKEGKYILERIQLVNLESEATIGFAGTTSRGESDDYTTTEEGLRRALQAYVGSNSETVMLLGGTL